LSVIGVAGPPERLRSGRGAEQSSEAGEVREALARRVDQLLDASRVRDYCPNRSRQASLSRPRFAHQFLDAGVRERGTRSEENQFFSSKTNGYEQKLSFKGAVQL